MKIPTLTLLFATIALGFGAGCSHVDLTAEAKRTRVLSGTLNTGLPLPAGAEVLVRLIAVNRDVPAASSGADSPAARPGATAKETIIGELVQTLAAPSGTALPFQLEFDADDALLRRGVNLEARIYYNGRVRFRTINAHVVSASSVHFPQTVTLQAVER
jgi:uncharacterized lipoprotein YbaY